MADEESYLRNLQFEPVSSPYEASVVYANYEVPNGTGVSVISDGPEIGIDKAQALAENASKSILIAEKINGGNKIEWLSKGLKINFPKEASKGLKVLMDESFNANLILLDYDGQSQISTVLHELVEGLQEDIPNFQPSSNETLPLTAEFLFSGPSRQEAFRMQTDKSLSGDQKGSIGDHDKGWKIALQVLAANAGLTQDLSEYSVEELMGKIDNLRALPENEKLRIVSSIVDKYTIITKTESE